MSATEPEILSLSCLDVTAPRPHDLDLGPLKQCFAPVFSSRGFSARLLRLSILWHHHGPSPAGQRIFHLLDAAYLFLSGCLLCRGTSTATESPLRVRPEHCKRMPGPAASPIPVFPFEPSLHYLSQKTALVPATHCNSGGRHVPVGTPFGHVSTRRGVPKPSGILPRRLPPVSPFSLCSSRHSR